MSRPDFHVTWTRLRALDESRPWMGFQELYGAIQAAGLEVSTWKVRRELARLPRPERRYQMNRYTPEHLAAVIERLKNAAAKEQAT